MIRSTVLAALTLAGALPASHSTRTPAHLIAGYPAGGWWTSSRA
jgi:hypothetical protein